MMENKQFTVGRYYVEIEKQDPYDNNWYFIKVSAPDGSELASGNVDNNVTSSKDTFMLHDLRLNTTDDRINDGINIILEISESIASRRGAGQFVLKRDREYSPYLAPIANDNNYTANADGNYTISKMRELYGANLSRIVPEDDQWKYE